MIDVAKIQSTKSSNAIEGIYTNDTRLKELMKKKAEPKNKNKEVAFSASDEVPDRQGRVTIPAVLRTYAGLGKEIVVVGAINRVEVCAVWRWWQRPPERWSG